MQPQTPTGNCAIGALPQVLFRIQRQLNHPLQELVGAGAGKVVKDQLLGEETRQMSQLERLVASGEIEACYFSSP